MVFFPNSPHLMPLVLIAILLVAAGCVNPSGTVPSTGSNLPGGAMGGITGPNNCASLEECTAYCSAHYDVCEQYCRDHADVCSRFGGAPSQKPTEQ
jgi:hypothetical protein